MSKYQQIFKRILTKINYKTIKQSPISTIVITNTILLVAIFLLQFAWRIKGFSQEFLIRHFSFQRFNIRNNRIYTFITYAFSHFTFLSYFFDMFMTVYLGNIIRFQFGNNKYIWMLYLSGALFGGLSMHSFMPYSSMIIPQVGSDGPISAMITFYALSNMQKKLSLFFIPMRVWFILSFIVFYSIVADPTRKNFGGILGGLLIHRMFRVGFI